MAEKIEQKTLAELLKSTPAGGPYAVPDFTLSDSGNQWILNQPALQLYCNSDVCAGYRFFDLSFSNFNQPSTTVQYIFMTYKCRNCRRSPKTFALRAMSIDASSPSIVVKIGEFPFYGSPVSPRLSSFLGQDSEIFLQGQRAENAGFGFGAFSYYRRVVENAKTKFISETARIAQKAGANEEVRAQFEKAEKEPGFGQAIVEIRGMIPPSLLIHGQNPLNLLRSALNEGVQAQTDAECLEIAASIRIILTELAERISAAQEDNGELSGAVNRLLNSQRKPQPPTV
jgi:hypothetical protein